MSTKTHSCSGQYCNVLISQRLLSGLFLNSSIDMQAPELKLQGDWGRWGLGTV